MRSKNFVAAGLFLFVVASCGGDSTAKATVSALRFSTQPANVVAGQAFSVVVELDASNGARVAGATNAITLTAGTLTISGPSTVTAVDGVATFNGLSINQIGSNLQLTAATTGLTTSSGTFSVAAGPPDLAHSSVTPSGGTISPNVTTAFSFVFKDAFGNPVPSAAVSLTTPLVGATFTPSSGTTSASGAFSTNFKSTAQGSAPVTATVAGIALTFATAYTIVDLCPPTTMAFPGTVNGSLPSGGCVIQTVPSAAFRFTTTSQVVAAFTITSALAGVGYEVTADPPASNLSVFSTQSPTTGTWLLPAGTFQFHVGSAAVGAFSISSAVAQIAPGCSELFLATGGVYTGQTLVSTDCTLSDGSFYDAYVIASSLPCTITMRSTDFDSYLFALDLNADPNLIGTVMDVEDDNSAGGQDARVSLAACQAPNAPLFIAANNYPDQSGAYTLTITLGNGAAVRLDSPEAAPFVRRVRLPSQGLGNLLLHKAGLSARRQ